MSELFSKSNGLQNNEYLEHEEEELFFKSYDEFLAGLRESLNSEYYGDKYPEYEEECDQEEDIDVKYINHFIQNGLDIHHGLELLIDTLCSHSRYVEQSDIEDFIQPFLNAGADINKQTIFYIPIISNLEEEFEDKTEEIFIRVAIIKTFQIQNNSIDELLRDDNVEPLDWEDILEYNEENEYNDMKLPFYQFYKFLLTKSNQ
jgi:hypothetical protein